MNFSRIEPVSNRPDFCYSPSKNPYWAKIQEHKGLVFTDQETEKHSGTWKTKFPSALQKDCLQDPSAELHVEIGCNAGHVIVEWAKANPQNFYLGMDWKFKPIFRGAEKSLKAKLKNLIFLRAHAERTPFIFSPGEVDFLYLFFPDPWPKKAHWKNRLITPERLKQLSTILAPTGIFHIKTDHPGYFDWILEAVSTVSDTWTILELNRDLYQGHPAPEKLNIPEVTLFERLFIKDKIPIQSLKLQPKPKYHRAPDFSPGVI